MDDKCTSCNDEEWRPVVGYEGLYVVSTLGRVRNAQNERLLQGCWRPGEYRRVMLTKNGKHSYKHIHILVALAFLGPRPPRKDVNHRDGDKWNARLANLEYVTRTKNNLHYWTLPKSRPGGVNPTAKLTPDQVRQIRLLKGKESYAATAKRFDVTDGTVRHIHKGTIWRSLI